MNELNLTFEPLLDEAVRQHLDGGVDDHNFAMTGVADWSPVNLVLRSDRGEIAGGLMGHVWGGWLDIKILWVSAPFRGQGQARRLIGEAEAFAVERGAKAATLDTHNPQARALYERLGYRVVGELPDFPPGFSKTFMSKTLPSPPREAGEGDRA